MDDGNEWVAGFCWLYCGQRRTRVLWAGPASVAGALSFAEYRAGLEAAGFTGIEITPTHSVADHGPGVVLP